MSNDSGNHDDTSVEQTEPQTPSGQSASKKLSLEATAPPGNVPGYRLTQFLGSGAFGQVWIGRDLNTGRDVAVKFYLHRGGVNWSLLSREVKNLVQLSADRYVVQVLEVGWEADPPYYVMELIAGGSLEQWLQTHGVMPVAEAVELFRKICTGLNHCHAKGVLHCDLKPANILLGEDREPRLADFGQSRLTSEQTPALGTLFYMAPEQADLTATPDASWDVYAVGAIMYRLLTGQAPYRDSTIVKQLDTAGSLQKRLDRYRHTISTEPAPTAHLKLAGVDRALGQLVSKCLAVDPARRYANVQQILDDLDHREQVRSRRPLMLLGIVGPLLVLIATAFFSLRSIARAEESTKQYVRDQAFSSNQLAAAYAARTLEGEIERYFLLAERIAADENTRATLQATLASAELRELVGSLNAQPTPLQTHRGGPVREQFLDHPDRQPLVQLLNDWLGRYSGQQAAGRRPRLATMFITDAVGTVLAIAYDEPVSRERSSAGKNFAYRTYFHGGRNDLPKEQTRIGETQPLQSTHLSAAFLSTATGFWKVAVSTPIRFEGATDGPPDAMFVATINLGDFEMLQSAEGLNQVAVLVEARDGAQQGTILQHPLMDARRRSGLAMFGEKYQIPARLFDRLITGGDDLNYRDPLATADDGQAFAGAWLAAMQPVNVPDREEASPTRDQTDLLVLVQYRLETVLAPVAQMRRALILEGAAALSSIFLVTFTLWWLVRRSHQVQHQTPPPPTVDQNLQETMQAS